MGPSNKLCSIDNGLIVQLIENYTSKSKKHVLGMLRLKSPTPKSPLPTKRTKINENTLQTLARGHNSPLGLRYTKVMI